MVKVLVVGGSGGIGRQLVADLAVDKEVVVIGRDANKLNNLKKRNVKVAAVDISEEDQVKNFFNTLNKLDVLINCAAVLGPVGFFRDNSLVEWKRCMEINLMGVVNCCYYSLSLLLKSRRGKIINFSGGGAAYGRLGHTAYACSKTAVVRFTEVLAMEYPSIDINVIAPGVHKTDIWKGETIDKEPDEWSNIEELKAFVRFLVSSRSDGISGRFLHFRDNWVEMKGDSLPSHLYTLRRIDNYKFEEKK